MQYETIILELMSRVQRLEEEVSELKDIVEDSNNQAEAQPKKNVKVTPEMTRLCYEKAKQAYNNVHLDINELAQEVSEQTGMNYNTAKMNIYSITLDLCLDLICDEDGFQGLQKALNATGLHIEYLKTKNMATAKLLSVYNKYKELIGKGELQ